MLVKRIEKDNKIKAMYSSSTICASVFDSNTKDLTVIFNNGGQYKYPGVALTDYTRLEISESTGSDFNTYIKKKYTNFEKLDKITDTALTAILKDIEETKANDEKLQLASKTKSMLDAMNRLIAAYITTDKVNPTIYKQVSDSMADYNKLVTPVTVTVANVIA